MMASSEHAGTTRTANHDIDFLALFGGHQTLECFLMIEERISASEQGGVRVCLGETEQKLYRFDLFTPRPQPLITPWSRSLDSTRKAPIRAVSNIASQRSP